MLHGSGKAHWYVAWVGKVHGNTRAPYGLSGHKEVAWVKEDVGRLKVVCKRCNEAQVGCIGGVVQVWKDGLECLEIHKRCCAGQGRYGVQHGPGSIHGNAQQLLPSSWKARWASTG